MNYAKPLPRDKNDTPLQGFPAAVPALASYDGENASTSSVMTLTQDTTAIEIAANGGPAVMKWITQTDTTASVISATSGANYDHVIAKDTIRRFVVPREVSSATGYGSVMGMNRQEGLYRRVAVKSTGISSVMSSEY